MISNDQPEIEVKPNVSEKRVSHATIVGDEWLENFKNFLDEIENSTELGQLKKKCRTILSGYLLSFGIQDVGHENTATIQPSAIQTTSHYKAQMATTRTKDHIEDLLKAIDSATTFEKLLSILDNFAQELPPISANDKPSNTPITDSEVLVISVQQCRILVQSALRAASVEPGLRTDIHR